MRVSHVLSLSVAVMGMLWMPACALSQNGNLVRANSRYEDADYLGTIELADFILGQGPATPEIGAQAGLLKGFSLERLGRREEAVAVYQYIADNYGNSTSGAQARGRLAELSKH